MFKPLFESKSTFFLAVIQASCMGHCIFEYIGDLVTVNEIKSSKSIQLNSLFVKLKMIQIQFFIVDCWAINGTNVEIK